MKISEATEWEKQLDAKTFSGWSGDAAAIDPEDAKKIIREAIDSETRELNKIIQECLAVMPFGNIRNHTPENLPSGIADLASECARLTNVNDDLVEALKALHEACKRYEPTCRKNIYYPDYMNLAVLNAATALSKAGAE